MTMPTVSDDALYAYGQLAGYTAQDAANGYPLLLLLDVLLSNALQDVDDLVRDDGDTPGWGKLLDVDLCPAPFLPWLGQLHGTALPTGLTEQQQRDYIRNPSGPDRGTPDAIIAAAKLHLTGSQTVIYRDRDPGAYSITVVTKTSETPTPAQTLADILSQKPIGMLLNHIVETFQDWDAVSEDYTDWAAVNTAYTDWAAVAAVAPN